MKPPIAARTHRTGSQLLRLLPAIVLSGCASSALEAQWANPDQAPRSLKGSKVLVSCEANELVVRQICQDKLAARLTALGAVPVKAEVPAGGDGGASDTAARQAAAARSAGAQAVFSVSVAPELSESSHAGMSVGIGLGGFGIGRGSFGGVGVSAPIGEGRPRYGYTGNGALTSVEGGSLLWTAKTRAQAADTTEQQLQHMAEALADGAQKAGHF